MVVPLKFDTGVKVTTPDAFTVNVPWPATVKVVWIPAVDGSRSTEVGTNVPSTSESFDRMDILTGVSSGVVAASFTATGGSLTGVTVTVMFAVAHCAGSGVPLSHTL